MKKVTFDFNSSNPTTEGLKFILFKITTDQNQIVHDWGFCEWLGNSWGEMEVPENYTCEVKWWADTVDPAVLLAVPSKIIGLN